jgi:hypothetical protein
MMAVLLRLELAVMVAGPVTGIPKSHGPPPPLPLRKVIWTVPFLEVDTEEINSAVSPG